MKTSTLFIAIVVGFLTPPLTAQETIWFDSNWNVSTKENATYYRPSPKKMDKGYWIVDYYISGQKQMEGLSTTSAPNNEKFEGVVHFFHKNGTKFQVVNYLKGKPEGKFSEFYDTKELQRAGKYTNGLREGIWKTFYKNGKIKTKGKYRDGKKVGIWKTFYKNVY